MNEEQVTALLEERHARRNDIFVSQCKTGSSQYDENDRYSDIPVKSFRFDAWAMTRSWFDFCMIGYEIKTSMEDFLRDKKWVHYLKHCNKFFFVITNGLLNKRQLAIFAKTHKCCGIIEVTRNGKGLRTILQPSPRFRKVKFPESLIKYVLFWRTEIR